MKKVILTSIICSFCCMYTFSQELKVVERRENIGKGVNNALCIELPITSTAEAITAWKLKLKEARAKVKGRKEIIGANAIIPSVSLSAMTIYVKFREMPTSTTFIAAFDLGKNYLKKKSDPQTYENAKKYLLEYALEVSKQFYDSEIKINDEELARNQKELDELKRKRTNTEKDIVRFKELLMKAEADTLDNNALQATSLAKIESTQLQITTLKENKDKLSIQTTSSTTATKPIESVTPAPIEVKKELKKEVEEQDILDTVSKGPQEVPVTPVTLEVEE